MKKGKRLWTLDELAVEVAKALAEGYDGAASGRVRDVPDRRTIRYYTTLGLIDRPAEMRGRTAFYGRRHLLQIVAIKKLQALGRSLAEIQRETAGQTDAHLSRITGPVVHGAEPSADGRPGADHRRDFWRGEPAAHAPPVAESENLVEDAAHFVGVPLDPGVTLLLAPARPLGADDLAAIRRAAAPLIDMLTRARLIEPREQGDLP